MPRWVWIAGGAVLIVAAYVLLRRRAAGSTAGTLNTSGTPGPDLTGSAAQQPNGGASNAAGNLPTQLVSQPDQLQQQVQQTGTGDPSAPTMIQHLPTNGPTYVNPPPLPGPPTYVNPPNYFGPPTPAPPPPTKQPFNISG